MVKGNIIGLCLKPKKKKQKILGSYDIFSWASNRGNFSAGYMGNP